MISDFRTGSYYYYDIKFKNIFRCEAQPSFTDVPGASTRTDNCELIWSSVLTQWHWQNSPCKTQSWFDTSCQLLASYWPLFQHCVLRQRQVKRCQVLSVQASIFDHFNCGNLGGWSIAAFGCKNFGSHSHTIFVELFVVQIDCIQKFLHLIVPFAELREKALLHDQGSTRVWDCDLVLSGGLALGVAGAHFKKQRWEVREARNQRTSRPALVVDSSYYPLKQLFSLTLLLRCADTHSCTHHLRTFNLK